MFSLLVSVLSSAQQKHTIGGIIKNKTNGETIIGASVKIIGKTGGTVSNEYGFYSLSLAAGSYQLEITAIGKKTDTIRVDLNSDVTRNISMEEEARNLDEVFVSSKPRGGRSISGTQTGVE